MDQAPFLLKPPTDVQQLIFAEVADDSAEGKRNIGSLACVSIYFRNMLANDPSRWKYVELSMLWEEAKIANVWNTATEKVGKTPLVVLIHDIGADAAQSFNTLHVHLKKTGVKISSLTLELYQSWGHGINQLTEFDWTGVDPFQTLTLRYMDTATFDDIHADVLLKFPSTTALCMENILWITAVPNAPWLTNLKSLKLGSNECSCLHQFLGKTPNLVNLELTGTSTSQDDPRYGSSDFPTDVTLPKLKVMKIDTNYTWLNKIVCPALTTFVLGSTLIPYEFLDTHSSTITSLQVRGTLNFQRLFATVPHLMQLCLTSSKWIADSDPNGISHNLHFLTRLEELTIHDEEARITIEMFEVLVSTRKLPLYTTAVPPEKQRLKVLTILTPKHALDAMDSWIRLPFVPKDIVEEQLSYYKDPCGFKLGHPNCSKYTMKWS